VMIWKSRWDIDIRFDELLMPEFIGGISRELSMRTVEQTVDQQKNFFAFETDNYRNQPPRG
jgi:hypothetical protein